MTFNGVQPLGGFPSLRSQSAGEGRELFNGESVQLFRTMVVMWWPMLGPLRVALDSSYPPHLLRMAQRLPCPIYIPHMATDDLDLLTATFRGDFVGTFFQSSYHSNGAMSNSPYRVDDLHCIRPKIAILFGYDGDWLEIAAATRRHGWIAAAWRSKVRYHFRTLLSLWLPKVEAIGDQRSRSAEPRFDGNKGMVLPAFHHLDQIRFNCGNIYRLQIPFVSHCLADLATSSSGHSENQASWFHSLPTRNEFEFCLIIIELIHCVQVAHPLFPDFPSRIQQA